MPTHVIAIDGPAASGKSSTAKAVARALGFAHLDSGALYRGVTLVAMRECGAAEGMALDPGAVLLAAERRGLALHYDGTGFGVYLEGEPVDQAIRSAGVTALVSAVSALPEVREWVNGHLRALARAGQSLVVDGRDIGTVVFPEAVLKVFLTASPRVRAARRLAQRGEAMDPAALELETAALEARDAADSQRHLAPLKRAADAVTIDTDEISLTQQIEHIVKLARDRIPPGLPA